MKFKRWQFALLPLVSWLLFVWFITFGTPWFALGMWPIPDDCSTSCLRHDYENRVFMRAWTAIVASVGGALMWFGAWQKLPDKCRAT